jgi:hypothetical protein
MVTSMNYKLKTEEKIKQMNEESDGRLLKLFEPLEYNGKIVLATKIKNDNCVDDVKNGNLEKLVSVRINGIKAFSKRNYFNGNETPIPCTNCSIQQKDKDNVLYGAYRDVDIEHLLKSDDSHIFEHGDNNSNLLYPEFAYQ